MKDAFGRELKVGDEVAHVSRHGSCMSLSVLEVVSFDVREPHYGNPYPVARCRTVRTTGYRTPDEKLHTYTNSYLVKLEAL